MERCDMCGARIAPSSYQVLAPELEGRYCSANCAERALLRAKRPRPVGLPKPPVQEPPKPAAVSVSPELALVDETLRRAG